MSLKTLKLITFDVTNTLLKFLKKPGHQYVEVGAMYNLQISNESNMSNNFKKNYKMMSQNYPNFGKDCGISWEDWWREIVKNSFKDYTNDEKILNSIADHLINMYKTDESWRVADGSIELLEYLKDKNIKLGIVSNFDPRLTDILRNMEIISYFDFVLTSYDAGFVKPNKKIFAAALSKSEVMQICANEALHIGDNAEYDYMGAKNAGWYAAIVNSSEKKCDILLNNKYKVQPQHIFESLRELKQVLENESFQL